MATIPKNNRRGQEPGKNRKNRLTDKALSFHGRIPEEMPQARIQRPKTLPNLLSGQTVAGTFPEVKPKLTKLLLNVTIQGSLGPVQVVMSPESTVGDMIAATVRQYTKEGRRPILAAEPSRFDLHYSQFSLESLDREEKLMALGSRNFFLCPKKSLLGGGGAGESSACGGGITTTSSPSCSKEVETPVKSGFSWLKFMDFLP